MFLIRAAFWTGLVVLLLPTDERQQARLFGAATTAVERVTTFCDRNTRTCEVGSEVWAAFLKKAEFGARMAFELITTRGGAAGDREDVRVSPPAPRARWKEAAPRGTLTRRHEPTLARTAAAAGRLKAAIAATLPHLLGGVPFHLRGEAEHVPVARPHQAVAHR
jgi:hypothetical protein